MTTPTGIDIRLLSANDAGAYQTLRLEGLRQTPEAFGSSYEEEIAFTLEQVVTRLTGSLPDIASFGAFQAGSLAGIATLMANRRPKLQHRAALVAMYVTPTARGRGIGRRLVDAVITYGRSLPQVETLTLGVSAGNTAARQLYANAGFRAYATEPRYLKIDGVYHDLDLMERSL